MQSLTPKFEAHLSKLPKMLEELRTHPGFKMSEIRLLPKFGAIYAFYENGKPLYVGRTKNLRQRMGNHTSAKPGQSAFAFRLARILSGHTTATYKPKGSRKDLMTLPEFKGAFDKSIDRIKAMSVKFVKVENAVDQHLFELYAALALGTPHNEFGTT